MLPRLKPRCFYDLVIEVAIVRPGPIQGGMVHPYLRRRDGIDQEHYPSPDPAHGPANELEDVLKRTLGVPLFQEQAMQIAITAAKFTPDEADEELRRAMATFRHTGNVHLFREKFIGNGMTACGYDRTFAENCFGQIEGFGEYGFPRKLRGELCAPWSMPRPGSKCRYPDVFCAAILNSQLMGFYQPAQLVRAMRGRTASRSAPSTSISAIGIARWRAGCPTLTATPTSATSRGENVLGNHAVRLGFRLVHGLMKTNCRSSLRSAATALPRSNGWRRSPAYRVSASSGWRAADAFRSMGPDRRAAL